MGWGLKIKIFKIMGVHWKIQFLGGWEGGGVATKKGLRQFTDLTGGWQKRGGWCFEGVDTRMHTLGTVVLLPGSFWWLKILCNSNLMPAKSFFLSNILSRGSSSI